MVLTFFPKIRSTTPGACVINVGAEPSPGYRLLRVRGRGGFAEVWEAASPAGPVALKFMPSSNTGTTAREVRSIQSFQAFDHPYLVKTNGVWSVPGYIVIDMELAEATLLDLMLVYHNDLGQHIPTPQLCLYMWQVGEGLDFLNARRHTRDGRRVGFQHGDVKPNNVLLFGDVAKLTDYGLATPTHGPATPCPRHGTREYAPPEVFQGYLSDTSDQYSLAVTYHVLRTGVFPFPPPPAGDMPKSYLRPPADLSALLPAEQTVLARALSAVPQDRFGSCQEMIRGLLKAHGLKMSRSDDGVWRPVPDDETVPDPPSSKTMREIANRSNSRPR
ncbi:MAG: serine/threonine protein kinase [Gemmataceae bacterium]|nr:serine/threonine protein kinase [Gemmataceae bacterium]